MQTVTIVTRGQALRHTRVLRPGTATRAESRQAEIESVTGERFPLTAVPADGPACFGAGLIEADQCWYRFDTIPPGVLKFPVIFNRHSRGESRIVLAEDSDIGMLQQMSQHRHDQLTGFTAFLHVKSVTH